MRIWFLDSGSLVIDQAHITWNQGCGTPVRFPVYSVLIEHDDGLFLFDSGYELELVKAVLPFELPEQTPEQTIPAQLALCGFAPEDVSTLVMSHLHFDHVGGNQLLPRRGTASPSSTSATPTAAGTTRTRSSSRSPATRRSRRGCTWWRRRATRSGTTRCW